jgi:hypothetical protein
MDRSIKEVRSIYKNASVTKSGTFQKLVLQNATPPLCKIHIVGSNSSSRLGVLDICKPPRHQAFRMRHATPQGPSSPPSQLSLPRLQESSRAPALQAIQAPDLSMHFSRAYRRKGLVEMQALSWATTLSGLSRSLFSWSGGTCSSADGACSF